MFSYLSVIFNSGAAIASAVGACAECCCRLQKCRVVYFLSLQEQQQQQQAAAAAAWRALGALQQGASYLRRELAPTLAAVTKRLPAALPGGPAAGSGGGSNTRLSRH